MITKSLLGTVVRDQLKEFEALEGAVPRSALPRLEGYRGSAALVVKGVRRCGKSTLLKQAMKDKFRGDFHYFNFDDERIAGFKMEDFQTLMEVLDEQLGRKTIVFFDEVQNIHGWELFINRILREGRRVFITGSNANLLSKELGTHLTGRHVDMELYPFSFLEFLRAAKAEPGGRFYSTEEKTVLSKKFKEYFMKGGMPESVVLGNESILLQVVGDIIQKDVLQRHNIRKPGEFRSVVNFLIANSSNPVTYRSIKNNFGIKSANTVQKYVEYTEETYLLFSVRRFERKTKKFDKNPRKVYCIDNGIAVKNSPAINERKGALLENLIAIHLKRLGKDFYYYKGSGEADFLVPDDGLVVQACYEINDGNMKRELSGLAEAMEEAKAERGLILTFDQEAKTHAAGVEIMPAWRWLIESERAMNSVRPKS